MRLKPNRIWQRWLQGQGIFVGPTRPVSRVTVEPGWWFNVLEAAGWVGRAVHWIQRADLEPEEFEIPAVQQVQWNRSLDQDAATCTITLYNTWLEANIPDDALRAAGPPKQVGYPGWFTWTERTSQGVARWGPDTSPWRDVLTANALLRTYQGFGGADKPLRQAVQDGDLSKTGTWLVDDVQIDSGGQGAGPILTLTCRDLGSILVDGYLYPPLVPGILYPYECMFQRYFYTTATVPNPNALDADTGVLLGGHPLPPGELTDQPVRVHMASTQKDFPPDGNVLNHAPRDACDGDPSTFWYTKGYDDATGLDWIEFETTSANGQADVFNAITLGTWAPDPGNGSYHFYISISEDGVNWLAYNAGVPLAGQSTPKQANGRVPANPHYAGTIYATDIAYVAEGDLAWDFSKTFSLPRSYEAKKVRVSITGYPKTTDGPPFYRGAISEFTPAYDNVQNMRFGDIPLGTTSALLANGVTVNSIPVSPSHPVDLGDIILIDPGPNQQEATASHSVLAGTASIPVEDFTPTADIPAGTTVQDASGIKVVGICATSDGMGYWATSSIGAVVDFGGAPNYGDGTPINYQQPIVGIAPTPDNSGFWLVAADGGIFTYGTAQFYGSLPGIPVSRTDVVGMAVTPTGKGYWILSADGDVYTFGDATYHGGAAGEAHTPVVGMAPTPDGKGYWIASASGGVFTFGNAQFYGSMGGVTLDEPVSGIAATPSGKGYYLVAMDGGIFTFGDAVFLGSLPSGPQPMAGQPSSGYLPASAVIGIAVNKYGGGYWIIDTNGNVNSWGFANNYGGFYGPIHRRDGNFIDWSDVVSRVLLWCGWHLYKAPPEPNGDPAVHGIIETTGIPGPHPIDNGLQSYNLLPDAVCKKPPIDVIKQVRDIVGFIFYVGEDGEANFRSPNIWAPGNFDENGKHSLFVPLLDEGVTIMEYQAADTKKAMRSSIVISSNEPTANIQGTVTTTYVPAVNKYMHGLIMPLLHNDIYLSSPVEQQIYAELTGLRLWMSIRTGTITIIANPNLQVDDQVEIAAEVGQDTFLHHIRGINCTHNTESGEFTMQLTTSWLGDPDNWAVDFSDPTGAKPVTTSQTTSTPPIPAGQG